VLIIPNSEYRRGENLHDNNAKLTVIKETFVKSVFQSKAGFCFGSVLTVPDNEKTRVLFALFSQQSHKDEESEILSHFVVFLFFPLSCLRR